LIREGFYADQSVIIIRTGGITIFYPPIIC
jgi:hypothetical protein